jgi:regulator of nonsense transcripts 2
VVVGNEDDEEDDVVVLKRQEQQRREQDDDFEKEFSKMISDSIESRKFEKKMNMLDVPIPMNLRGAQGKKPVYRHMMAIGLTFLYGQIDAVLPSKKDNRPQAVWRLHS